MKSWHLRTPTSNETNITTLFFIFPINTSIRPNSFCCLWDCVVGHKICCSQIRPHTELGCTQEEQYTAKAAVIRRLCYSCKYSILFSSKTISLRTSCMDWNDYFYNKTHTTALLQLLHFFSFLFCSLTRFAGLAVWDSAWCSGRRRGGGGGHSVRLVPLLRTTLRGFDAFDSPGMAVSFVMCFCLALWEKTGGKKKTTCLL